MSTRSKRNESSASSTRSSRNESPIDPVLDKLFQLVVATEGTEEIVAECAALISAHKVTFLEIFNNVNLHKRIVGKFQ